MIPEPQAPPQRKNAFGLNPAWILDRVSRNEILRTLEFEPGTLEFFDRAAERINSSPELRISFAHEAEKGPNNNLSEKACPPDWGWDALLVASGLRKMQEKHRARDLPASITISTARDLERWVLSFTQGTSPLDRFPRAWFLNHLHRDLLEIGRLQFIPGKFSANCRIYSRRGKTGETVALADEDMSCTADGWLGEGGFKTVFEELPASVVAHPVDLATGRINVKPIALSLDGWELRLSTGSPVLEVHIPSGAPLVASECTQSFEQAELIFENFRPELAWQAFSCTSWMLDREVHGCLPRTSGVVAFGDRFRALPARESDDRQLIERVFPKTEDWRTFESKTSLQRAVQNHLRKGGSFRSTSGFILRGDQNFGAAIPNSSQPQAS